MQSVDESYEFVSLETDAGAGGDAREAEPVPEPEAEPRVEAEPEPEPEPATVFEHYPPRALRELAEENGIHYFEDGHFYTEVSDAFKPIFFPVIKRCSWYICYTSCARDFVRGQKKNIGQLY